MKRLGRHLQELGRRDHAVVDRLLEPVDRRSSLDVVVAAPSYKVRSSRPVAERHRQQSGRRATVTPALQPGARPPAGGRRDPASRPARSTSHAITEFEFDVPRRRARRGPRRASARAASGRESGARSRARSSESGAVDLLPRRPDHAVAPAAELVAKQPRAAGRPSADRTAETAPRRPRRRADGRRLDHEPAVERADDESRVAQVAGARGLRRKAMQGS